MNAINITAYPSDNSQIEAIKAVMKALKIKFQINDDKPYNPEFVAKIKKSKQDYLDGKGTVMTMDELNELWK
jgi:geranylgeranyl pyrophosphate synthase